jgi:hypothetical protein
VRDGHGAIVLEQQVRHWLADDVGAADHQRALARHVGQDFLDQDQATQRGAGHDGVLAEGQAAGVDGVETIHIFGGIHRCEDFCGVGSSGQWQLHEDAVHLGISVQAAHQLDYFGGGGGFGEAVVEVCQAGFFGLAGLAGHIYLAGRIAAHQDYGQAGHHSLLFKLRGPVGYPLAKPFRYCAAVDDCCGHGFPL